MLRSQKDDKGHYGTRVEAAMSAMQRWSPPMVELNVSATLLGVWVTLRNPEQFVSDDMIFTEASGDHVVSKFVPAQSVRFGHY